MKGSLMRSLALLVVAASIATGPRPLAAQGWVGGDDDEE